MTRTPRVLYPDLAFRQGYAFRSRLRATVPVMRTLAALTFLVTLTACGDYGPDEPAGLEDFIEQQFDREAKGQFGRLYDSLHPLQQDVIDRNDFDLCSRQGEAFPDLDSVQLVETYEEAVAIPGTDETLDTTAATVRLEVDGESDTSTFHYVEVDGDWRWFVADPEAYTDC